MKTYTIKEIFYTVQGEGYHAGRPAVFVRFAGCNLWTGREADRATAVCTFCDTDFVGTDGPGGGKYTADALARKVRSLWPDQSSPFVVCTGGEPLLQLDEEFTDALHRYGSYIAVETNGTMPHPPGVDWVCVSPKAGADLVLRSGDELKLVYPQNGAPPEAFRQLDFAHFFLQPMDGPDRDDNTRRALEYCMRHPRWKISLQIHKILGIP